MLGGKNSKAGTGQARESQSERAVCESAGSGDLHRGYGRKGFERPLETFLKHPVRPTSIIVALRGISSDPLPHAAFGEKLQ